MCSTVVVSRFTESRVPRRCAASTMSRSVPGMTLRWTYPSNLYFVADEIDDLDHSLSSLASSSGDPRTQEEALDGLALEEVVEGFGEFVDFETVAFAGHPVTVRAEMAVHLAEIGEHHLHQVRELAVWETRAVDARPRIVARDRVRSALLDRHRALPCLCRRQDDIVGRHLAEVVHLCPSVRSSFREHDSRVVLGRCRFSIRMACMY